jgi:hypothetical protein
MHHYLGSDEVEFAGELAKFRSENLEYLLLLLTVQVL